MCGDVWLGRDSEESWVSGPKVKNILEMRCWLLQALGDVLTFRLVNSTASKVVLPTPLRIRPRSSLRPSERKGPRVRC